MGLPESTAYPSLEFARGIYRHWDPRECHRIIEVLDLPMDRKVKALSRGETAKLALVIALSHRPNLLILDEPTTGLDPLVREEFLQAIIHLLPQEGRTVFFSTHILSDVDRVADRLVVMNEGRVLAQGELASLRAKYTKASFLFPRRPEETVTLSGAVRVQKGLREWIAIFPAMDEAALRSIASRVGASDCLSHPVTVEDVFLLLFESRNG